jgi:hypothetical protein
MKAVAVIQWAGRSTSGKPLYLDAGFRAVLHPDAALAEIEQHQKRQHAEYGDGGDPGQRALVKGSVIAPLRLLQESGRGVRNADPALDFLSSWRSCCSLTDWAVGLLPVPCWDMPSA